MNRNSPGRPPGIPKSGGRQKGGRNKKTAELIQKVEASGVTPLEYMLSVMRDVTAEPPERLDAAKSAAPYIHPRLSQIEANMNHTIDHDRALQEIEQSLGINGHAN